MFIEKMRRVISRGSDGRIRLLEGIFQVEFRTSEARELGLCIRL